MSVALSNHLWAPVPVPVLDELGMPLAGEGAALHWIVAVPGDVVRAAGAGTASEPVGTIPLLPGAGLPLPHGASSCFGWAGWLDDDAAVLVCHNRIERFELPAGRPPADLPRDAGVTVWLESGQGIFVGAAFAPDGRVAVFQATAPEDGAAHGRVDLLILDRDGRTVQRAADVSDLVSNGVIWRTVPAAWSPNGSTLAFVAFRAAEADMGDPAQVHGRLVTWDAGTGAVTVHEAAATDVSWRPGADDELWIRTQAGWQVFDPATGASRPAGVDIWWVRGFSPDGRYLLALREDGHVVVALTTGEVAGVRALQPLGWDPADGYAYWVTSQDGRSHRSMSP